jgi:hypothetical protein
METVIIAFQEKYLWNSKIPPALLMNKHAIGTGKIAWRVCPLVDLQVTTEERLSAGTPGHVTDDTDAPTQWLMYAPPI